MLIGDSHGNRFHVAVFANDGGLLAEFECPHVKVGHKVTMFRFLLTNFPGFSLLWLENHE